MAFMVTVRPEGILSRRETQRALCGYGGLAFGNERQIDAALGLSLMKHKSW